MPAAPEQLVNPGLPVLFLALPVAFYLLIPIIAVETWRARKLAEVDAKHALAGVVAANTISAVVGWPLTWAIFAAMQGSIAPVGDPGHGALSPLRAIASGAVQTGWLALNDDWFYWMIPVAAVIVMIPAFVITLLIEGIVLKSCWRRVPTGVCLRFVFSANLYSFGLALLLIWLLYATASIALSITLVAAIFCILWTLSHRPREHDLESIPDYKAKMREFMVLDIRANSQYCSWYITLIGGLAAIVAANQNVYRLILNQQHLWPFGLSFLAASIATVFFPAGYGHKRFKTLRIIWFRSVVCEQFVIIFTCYGVCNAFIALTHGQGLSDKATYLQLF